MAIIVDKAQKKKDIALACKDLLVQSNINDLTISQIAKTAKIGKGTFYEYFSNKEELVFELVNILMHIHNAKKSERIELAESTREKIKVFYEFFYEEEASALRSLYQEFIAISLLSPRQEMITFQTECFTFYYKWVEKLIDEGIASGELQAVAKDLIKGMYTMGEGMFVASLATKDVINLKSDINCYVDNIFNLVEIKEK